MIVMRDHKIFCFNFYLPNDVDVNLKHKIEFIVKSNESIAKIIIKNEIEQLFLKYKHETILMNTENSKTNEPQKFILNLLQRLDLRSSDKCVALHNLSIFYTWKNIRRITR